MKKAYHPLVKRLLDGELAAADLPPELRADGEEALRWLGAVDRTPVSLPAVLEDAVMARVRGRSRSPVRRVWRWLIAGREVDLRFRLRPWTVGMAAVAAAAIAFVAVRPSGPSAPSAAPVYVRFILYAPGARTVSVAGTFNQWDPAATPLAPTASAGVWTTTVPLSLGQHQYAFLVDGVRWVTDPAAPTVDDGFGQRNSVMAVAAQDGRGRAL